MRIFARKYMPVRAVVLGLIGTCVILAVAAGRPAPSQQVDRPAPELKGSHWLNTPTPITLASRKGKVTLLEFFAYQCINCRHNVPAVARLYRKFKNQGVEFIGIHTPELPDERNPANVKKFVEQQKIDFPILLDPDYVNWDRWKQQYWPAVYLVDKKGRVRFGWIGELDKADEAQVAEQITALSSEG